MEPFFKTTSTLPIRQKVVLGFGLALLMLVLIALMAYRSTAALIRTAEQVNHARQVLETEQAMLRHLTEAESTARGYVAEGRESLRQAFEEAEQSAKTSFTALAAFCAGDPPQHERLQRLGAALGARVESLRKAVVARQTGGVVVMEAAFPAPEDRNEVKRLAEEFETSERRLLGERSQAAASIGRVTKASAVAASVLTAFMLTIACAFILRDISARRRVEAALEAEHNLLQGVMDAIPDQVLVKDTEGRYVIDNAAHRSFIGVTSGSVEGRTAFDFFPAEMAEMYQITDSKVIQSGKPLLDQQEPSVDREGRLLWLSTTKAPLRDREQKIIGLVAVSTDISERKRAEEELRLTTAQLQRSNSDLNDFASVASHDLQEPLRKIMAFGDRLRIKCGPQLGELGQDYLGRMAHAAARMQRLIQDLLTLSRITSKAQPFVDTDLHHVVQEVVSDLEVRIEQSSARIEVGRLPTIAADPLQMRQLFQNLLSNALKFQRPGEVPIVNVSGKVLEVQEPQIPGAAPGDQICQIVVQDNGIGFEQKFAEKIFTVFQRLHGKLEYEGTGIGLAVVRKIADRHGGVVIAKSDEGEGATFIVTLPVKQRMKHLYDETR